MNSRRLTILSRKPDHHVLEKLSLTESAHIALGWPGSARGVARIGAFIGDLDRRAQLLDHDVAAEAERAQVFDPFDAAYTVLARTWAARRDNLKATSPRSTIAFGDVVRKP
jgi:hypothetical protein